MNSNPIARTAVLVTVLVLASLVTYQKFVDGPGILGMGAGGAHQAVAPSEAKIQAAIKSGKPTMILFHSKSCSSCKEMLAVIDEIKPQYVDRVDFIDVMVSDRAEASLIDEFGINSVPTSVFLDKTGSPSQRAFGVVEKDKLIQILTVLEQ